MNMGFNKRRYKLDKFINKYLYKIITCIGIILFVFLGLKAFKSDKDNTTDIWLLTKYAIKSELKAPSSAKFPSKDKANIMESKDGYIVTSYVDAENSFGAKIRSEFKVMFEKNSNGEYIIKSIYIN